MKRFLAILLIAAMVISFAACGRIEEPQVNSFFEDDAGLPVAKGDEEPDYLLVADRFFDLLGADIEVYEHQKTKAAVIFIQNEDINRAFEITFRTPAENDMGVPHVFEHSTLDGSEKYPSKSLFFNLSSRTYNTFMNGATYNIMTTFPVASMSEEQLLKYADYYTDSCFNPMIYEDESIFQEEAWRYVLKDENGPLEVAGTVYTEMEGAFDIDAASDLNFRKSMFPGSYYAYESGGVPAEILKMQWKDITDYHSNYYHPSNSITCIYGKIEDKDAFLELLDTYFDQFEYKSFDITDSLYTPLTSSVSELIPYGVYDGTKTEGGSNISYGFILGQLSKKQCWKLDMLITLLNDNGSVFSQNMKEQFPSANYGCYYDFNGPEAYVEFYAYGVEKEDGEAFRKLVDDSLTKTAAEDFTRDTVEAISVSTRLDVILSGECSDIGVSVIPELLYYYYGFNDIFAYIEYIEELDNFIAYYEDGSLNDCLSDLLLTCERKALVTTYPQPGLKEVEDAVLAKSLNDSFEAMSFQDRQSLIASSDSFNDENYDSTELVRKLQAVTVDNLPVEYRIYDTSDETDNEGVRRLDVYANTDGVGTVDIFLDASGLEFEQIQYFKLFTQLLGQMDTAEHTSTELAALETRYLYDGSIGVSLTTDEEGWLAPFLKASFTAFDEDLREGYELIYELIFNTSFSNTNALSKLVSGLKNSLKRNINAEPYLAQMSRINGWTSDLESYYDYINYLPYYDFLCNLENQLKENPAEVVYRLESIQSYFNNRNGAIFAYAGSEESCSVNRPIADAFAEKLNYSELEAKTYDFELPDLTEAIIVDSSVNYNMVYADYWDMGLIDVDDEEESDVDLGTMIVLCAYVQDQYLYPELREQYGAYGVYCDLSDYGVYILSYRDPNVWESFDAYMGIPDWLEEKVKSIDQDTLNDYILSSFAYYAAPYGELTGAQAAITGLVSFVPQEDTLDFLNELKNVSVASFREYSGCFRSLIYDGLWSTSGSMYDINENFDIYDNILKPFESD